MHTEAQGLGNTGPREGPADALGALSASSVTQHGKPVGTRSAADLLRAALDALGRGWRPHQRATSGDRGAGSTCTQHARRRRRAMTRADVSTPGHALIRWRDAARLGLANDTGGEVILSRCRASRASPYSAGRLSLRRNGFHRASPCSIRSRGSLRVYCKPGSRWPYARSSHSKARSRSPCQANTSAIW